MKELSARHSILVVDDVPDNIQILMGLLSKQYKIQAATNGERALKIAQTFPQPDMILLDVMMPEMDGFEVCKQLKANAETAHIPVIFVTAKTEQVDETQGFDLGAIDYIAKPYNPAIVKTRVKAQLALSMENRHLEMLVKERTQELVNTRKSIINKLGKAAEYKDNETGLHVIRMSLYTKLLAEKVSNDEQWIELIYNAAPMHDVGKIGIPDAILRKPDKLDADEWKVMMTHAEIGGEILGDEDSTLLKMAREVAINHHEKWNGKGYPTGLVAEEIPLTARIVAIADVFDALTSERPYKKAWSIEKTIALIEEESGKHFDPSLVPLFLSCIPEIKTIMKKHGESSVNG
jgi:putative two-component system response regulator